MLTFTEDYSTNYSILNDVFNYDNFKKKFFYSAITFNKAHEKSEK